MKFPLHPVCRLFPPMPEEERDRLTDNIRRHGLLQPMVLPRGAILDGRQRLEACRRAGVPPRFVAWRGGGSPLEWVIAQNVVRRHLSPSQCAVLARAVLPLLEQEANQRMRLSAPTHSRVAQKCATLPQGGCEPRQSRPADGAPGRGRRGTCRRPSGCRNGVPRCSPGLRPDASACPRRSKPPGLIAPPARLCWS